MLLAGIYHTLTVARISDHGLYLANDEGDEVLLPNRYVSLSDKVGDQKEVFVYHDSENRPIATTLRPLAVVGEVAFLRVVDKNIHGVFLDWGLSGKDLFLPNKNQPGRMDGGSSYPIFVYRDSVTGRVVASSRLSSFLSNAQLTVAVRDEVDLFVAMRNELGFRVVINNRHWGMLYHNQIFSPMDIGDRTRGYIRKITDDNRIDVSLQREGYDEVKTAADRILALLAQSGGSLLLGDQTAPEEINAALGMSKKVFKRAAGYLMKQGTAEVGPNSIKTIKK